MTRFIITETRERTEVYSVLHKVEAESREEAEQLFINDSPKIRTTEDKTNRFYKNDEEMTGYKIAEEK